MKAAESIWETIEEINANGGVDNESVQPTTPPGVSACSTGGASSAPQSSGGGCGCN